MFDKLYKPDVLSCLADLSNDEVMTPPDIATKILDLLPQEIFTNTDTKIIDPFCKSGVFLREAAKRFIEGEKHKFNSLQECIDWVFQNQLYGIAITELTSLLSRRSVYCSKYPNSPYSISVFGNENAQGNILYHRIAHIWEGIGDKRHCKCCGASAIEYDRDIALENHAYELIHIDNPKEIIDMKFDVVIGNPPYQLGFGLKGGNSANAKSIYNLFIDQAIKLNPKYLCMIVQSRWMTKTAQGIPDKWVEEQLYSNKYSVIHDYESADECFPGTGFKGGCNYFLWERDYNGKCHYYYHSASDGTVSERYDYLDSKKAGIVIRDPKAYSIIEKLEAKDGAYYLDNDKNFSGLVSAKHYFDNSELLTSNWTDYKDKKDDKHNIKYYLNINAERTFKWIGLYQLPKNARTKDLNKIFVPAAGGSGADSQVIGRAFYGEPGSVCSQTFLVIGYDDKKHNYTKEQCLNILSYMQTRFFRYLVSIKKKTQNGPRGVYQFVPMQDFNKAWSDEKLYKKYDLTKDEIELIESKIDPLDLLGGDD